MEAIQKNLESIQRKQSDLANYQITNEMIKKIDIEIIGHLGNMTSLKISGEALPIYAGYNDTKHLGYKLRALVELLDISREDGICLSAFKNIPVRVVINPLGGCVGIGHWQKDKFILWENFWGFGEMEIW